MSAVTLIAVVWLVACCFGFYAWAAAALDSVKTLQAQRRAGENGILEAIAHEAIVRDTLGALIAGLNAFAALVVLLTEPSDAWRTVITRIALTAGMITFTVMGIYGRVARVRIATMIRRLYAEVKGAVS